MSCIIPQIVNLISHQYILKRFHLLIVDYVNNIGGHPG